MFKFTDLPKKVGEDYYQAAREEIIQYYSQNSDVLSVYEYGSVSSPGVSDLDIILVLKDNVKTKEYLFDFSNISTKVHHLLGDGTVMKMSKNSFININFLENKINVKKLYGEDFKLNYPDKTYRETLDLISVIDWLPERILRLTRVMTSKNINIIDALTLLHSYSYTILKVDNISKFKENNLKSQPILNKIKLLRNDWYSIDNPEQALKDCIQESISLGYMYLEIFENYLKNSNSYCKSINYIDEDINLELYENHFITFVNSKKNSRKESCAIEMSQNEKKYVLVSDYFYPHFECLARQEGILSNVMKKKFSPYKEFSEELLISNYKNNLIKKMNLAESNAKFLMRNNFQKGLFRYGFHFKNSVLN